METKIMKLGVSDLNEIMCVETGAFIPSIQASRSKVLSRLGSGHTYLGAKIGNELVGTIAFRLSNFSPLDIRGFPVTFNEFVNSVYDFERLNSISIYSLGVLPKNRSAKMSLDLLNAAFELARNLGMCYVVGDGRFPSYNGSIQFSQEKIGQRLDFKSAIDKCITSGTIPSREELLKDSTLAFYMRLVGLNPFKLISDFIPEDQPSGGHRVILYKSLK